LETCFVPNKYLQDGSTVYVGVLCDQCEFSLKASYVKEETLKDAESKLFHLKSGDRKVFILDEFFQVEKDSITISAFNLKVSQFKMTVDIMERNDPNNVISVPVSRTWIGGQQAIIKPSGQTSVKYDYRVILEANESGVFNIEAKTSDAIIPMSDRNLRFESVKSGEKICFSYKINKASADKDIIIEARSIKGELKLKAFPQGSTEAAATLNVSNEKDVSYVLSSDLRGKRSATDGTWLVCAESPNQDTTSFFTMQIFLNENKAKVDEYKTLLYSNISNLMCRFDKTRWNV
jgi:hypothetical protein